MDLPAGGDWSLASLEFLGDTGKPSEALRPADGPERYDGADATRRVRVTVGDRCEVTAVEVGRDWRDRVGPAGLAAALLEAYDDAVHHALTAAAGTAYEVAHARRDPAGGIAGGSVDPVADAAGDHEPAGEFDGAIEPGPEHLSRLWESLRRVEAALDALPDPLAGGAREAVAERALAGERGYLRVRVRDGVVVAVDGDAARIARATDGAVCAEALELLRRARRDAGAAEEG